MKKILACIAFICILLLLVTQVNDVLVTKAHNRYYMMEQLVEDEGELDVHVYGACHSYTSFIPDVLEEKTGLTSYVMGHPGEIVPTTYLRMVEQFKKDVPEVALVEVWGLNAYETYSSQDRIFTFYMPVDIELLPFSLEKVEVIRDYASLDMLNENLAIAKYKNRIMDEELTAVDFNYTLEGVLPLCSSYTQYEMTMRKENEGFTEMPMWLEGESYKKVYTPYRNVSDYHDRQPDIADDDVLPFEDDIVKYVEKIIALCEKNDVELIFYRAPYISAANELRKSNWFEGYCAEKGVMYIDLEKEIAWDLATDFLDYEHLNQYGAQKATEYLSDIIAAKAK